MKIKNEKGSITIFVLIGLLFMAAFLMISYGYNVNKSKIAKQQFDSISNIYSHKDSDENAYDRAYTALRKQTKQTLTASVEYSSKLEIEKSYADKISNYRIYGSLNGVGDKNLFPINSSNFYAISSSNVTIQTDGWININCDNTSGSGTLYINFWPQKESELLASTGYTMVIETQELSGISRMTLSSKRSETELPQFNTDYPINNMTSNSIYFIQMTSSSSFTNLGYLSRTFISVQAGTSAKGKIRISLIKGDITSENFAGYDLPGTYRIPIRITDEDNNSQIHNIYLNEQLNLGDYIDFTNGKVIRNDGTEESINLPELSTFEDYTKIEVLTAVTPSKIEVEYTGYKFE